jgi:hypothetical protein
MRVVYWTTIVTVLIAAVSCTSKGEREQPFYIGIWQGTYEGMPLSVEFRKDGRVILIHGGEDAIGLAGYSIDLQRQPSHLDIEFHNQSWGIIKTLIEQTGPDTTRIQHLKEQTPRPDALDSDAIILRRAKTHVLPRLTKTAEERDKKLQDALRMDIILFGGEQQEELLAICEAVFRYQFEHNASGAQQNAAAYFLSINRQDAPTELLDRFAGHSPPVKPGSQFRIGNGLKFRIDTLVWLDEATVEVEGGYYEGGLSASGNTYVLRRQKGSWRVIKRRLGWIS